LELKNSNKRTGAIIRGSAFIISNTSKGGASIRGVLLFNGMRLFEVVRYMVTVLFFQSRVTTNLKFCTFNELQDAGFLFLKAELFVTEKFVCRKKINQKLVYNRFHQFASTQQRFAQ